MNHWHDNCNNSVRKNMVLIRISSKYYQEEKMKNLLLLFAESRCVGMFRKGECKMKQFIQLPLIIFLGFVLTGCSLKYNLNPPISSIAEYENDQKEQQVAYVKDNLSEELL